MRSGLSSLLLLGPALLSAQNGPAGGSLEAFSETIQRLVHQASPGVVQVVADGFGASSDETGGRTSAVRHQSGIGTGVVLSADGDAITNAHVVSGARRIRVRSRGRLIDAQVVGVDHQTDLALLRLEGSDWPHLKLGDSSAVRQGEIVLAMGSPRGLDNSVSMGVVSSSSREISADASMSFIQTDAPINPGNSGGPLLNPHGDVVGINTFIFTESGGSEGLGFAIPSNMVRDIYGQLKKYGRVRRGEIGITIRSVTPALVKALTLTRERGVLVQDVKAGKAGDDAGLKVNDIIVGVEGRPVRNVRQFASSLFRSELGGTLKIEIVRGEQLETIHIPYLEAADATGRLADQIRDKATPLALLGIMAVDLNAETLTLIDEPRFRFGVIAAAKLETTGSLEEELEPGDLIFQLNGMPVAAVEPLRKLLAELSDDDPIVLQVQRGGGLRYLVLRAD